MEDIPQRFGYALHPIFLRTVIPTGVIGTYLLLNNGNPIYVGRSDTCILTRLLSHEHLSSATHVVWEPCKTKVHAFALESAWYHDPYISDRLINKIHPARPMDFDFECPFCNKNDAEALKRSLLTT